MSSDEEQDEPVELSDELREESGTDIYDRKRNDKQSEIARIKAEMDSDASERGEAPNQSLQLNHVFGYRGYDCHNNLVMAHNGTAVYHIAAVCVLQSDMDTPGGQSFYIGHTDDILCLALHPKKDLIASGQVGKDPSIHIWSVDSRELQVQLNGGHKLGVCAVDFSADGQTVVSIGLDDYHTVCVWDWTGSGLIHSVRGHRDRIFDVACNPGNVSAFVTCGVQHIKFWTIHDGVLKDKRGAFGSVAKMDTMFVVQHKPTDPQICLSGSASGQVYIWNERQLMRTLTAHEGAIYALNIINNGFISGGKDGRVCLWDGAFEKLIRAYALTKDTQLCQQMGVTVPCVRAVCVVDKHILVGTKTSDIILMHKDSSNSLLTQSHGKGEAWGLCAHPTQLKCCTASDDGKLRLFDYSHANNIRETACLELGGPGRSVAYSDDAKWVAVGRKDGSVQILDVDELTWTESFHDRQESISDVKYSKDGKYLAVASHDNFVDIYETAQYKRVSECKGASSYITHVDFSDDGELLRLNSGARELLYFTPSTGERQPLSVDTAETDTEWHTRTCVLGPQLAGVWPPGSDVTDVNAADVCKEKALVGTADDLGFVKLFRYPATKKHAESDTQMGHSAHVTNVRFSYDGDWLLSLGGADMALMLWKVID